jgi:hypothetical protein
MSIRARILDAVGQRVNAALVRLVDHAADVATALVEGRHDDAGRLAVDHLALTAACRALGLLSRRRA